MSVATSAGAVWVSEYTTSGGVEVAGHWRRRRTTSAVNDGYELHEDHLPSVHRHDLARTQQLGTSPSPPAATAPAAFSRDQEHQPTNTPPAHQSEQHIAATRAPAQFTPPGTDSLAVAEARYKQAQVAVGLGVLRKRGTGDTTALAAALRERDASRADLVHHQAQLVGSVPATMEQPPPRALQASIEDASEGGNRCPGCGQYSGENHQCPESLVRVGGNYADLKRDERTAAMVADLEKSVQAIVESGQLTRWMDAMASNGLNRWSANNRILAVMQMVDRGEPLEDLHMMGFRQWETLNRQVSKGSKAVWILAPITRKTEDTDEHGHTTESRRVVGFKSVPVFNVSDTHGEPLPASPIAPPPGEATEGTMEGLRARVDEAGYRYEEREIPGCKPAIGEGTLGYTSPETKQIVVDSRLNGAQKASVLAHELGHVHCGHVDRDYSEYQQHRGRMETEAEMTAYMVNRSRGMPQADAESFSAGYIASWSRNDPGAVRGAVDTSTRAFNKIMSGFDPAK